MRSVVSHVCYFQPITDTVNIDRHVSVRHTIMIVLRSDTIALRSHAMKYYPCVLPVTVGIPCRNSDRFVKLF